ncbi:MAG: carbohydrate-binding protein, partial [Bacteroidota bacterium]
RGDITYAERLRPGRHVIYKGIDLTGVREIIFKGSTENTPDGGGIIEIRREGPEGQVIGQVEILPTTDGRHERRLQVPLESSAGFTDLCLVFKSETSLPNQSIIQLDWMFFVLESGEKI